MANEVVAKNWNQLSKAEKVNAGRKKLTEAEAKELHRIVDEYREE